MSEEHDHDLQSDVGTEPFTDWEEVDSPVKTALGDDGDRIGTLALAGGGLVLFSAVRSLLRGQKRAIPKGVLAAGLLSAGLRRRGGERGGTFDPDALGDETDKTSDEAHTAANRETPDPDEQPREDPAADRTTADAPDDDGGDFEFTHDEPGDRDLPRSNAELDEAGDPRRDRSDESVEIDVSESALADEASEAAGPSPEQAQPSQTDATEPEETPEEDASDMKVDPDEAEDEREADGTRAGVADDADDEETEE